MQWETVIGLEIHVQLATASKIFSDAPTRYGAEPNTQANAVDLGLPGVLPVLNDAVVDMAIKLGVALKARISPASVFARKNYFYPDLPKGYQISQYDSPIVEHGTLEIRLPDGTRKNIRVTRAHLEEDAGKSVHDMFPGATGIDLNRAGTPLLEVVSEPDMRSPAEAVAYMRAMHTLVRDLGICDGNMQEGSFRCDANVSVRPKGTDKLGTRAEVKNINSFRFVERAIQFETGRQIELLESGGTVVQETRLYDADKDETRSMRSKEDAHDYRYFPDPDLLPIVVTEARIQAITGGMPELSAARRARYIAALGLTEIDAETISQDRGFAEYFEGVLVVSGDPRQTANTMVGEVSTLLNRSGLEIRDIPVPPQALGRLIRRSLDGSISASMKKQIFEYMWNGEGEADEIIESRGLRQVNDDALILGLIDTVIADNPDQVAQFRAGKDKVFGFFVGQVMKRSGGKANPQQLNVLLKRKLGGT